MCRFESLQKTCVGIRLALPGSILPYVTVHMVKNSSCLAHHTEKSSALMTTSHYVGAVQVSVVRSGIELKGNDGSTPHVLQAGFDVCRLILTFPTVEREVA